MNTAQYFYRNVIFSKAGNTISLIDINNPEGEKQELESWFGNVFQLADGQHTIEELTEFVSKQYQGGPPPNLKDTIASVIERMAESKLIILTDKKTELPYYLSQSIEKLDVEKAKILMEQDQANLN